MNSALRFIMDSEINKNYGYFQKVHHRKKGNKTVMFLVVYDTNGKLIFEKEFNQSLTNELKEWM